MSNIETPTTTRYANGKIYKIYVPGSNTCYIGSSCNKLSKRMATHRSHYKAYLAGTFKTKLTSYEILQHAGAIIELIEDYPCERKEQLDMREGYFIRNMICVNKQVAGAVVEAGGKVAYHKIQNKLYHNAHRNEIKAKRDVQTLCPECNYTIRLGGMAKHRRTAKHKRSETASSGSSSSTSIADAMERLTVTEDVVFGE